jgi:glycosyltransferase involved in cell wall biosynthesis|tara:strand:+ start:943 stop:2259 length:1317 start_codon:yes stop_codon:yes gene_type:complete
MNKPLVLVTAPVRTRSGYGNHSRDICRALIESNKYDIRIQAVRWGTTPMNALEEDNFIHQEIEKRILRQPNLEKQPDVHLHIVVPNEFTPIAKKNIGITAGIEHTVPPANWIEGVNRMDLTIMTSEWARDGFKSTSFDKVDNTQKKKVGELKVEKPMEVLFEGADPNIYKETKELSKDLKEEFSKIDNDFCFLYVGHWLQGKMGEDRKDTGMMLKVFLETFKGMKKKPALVMKTSGAGFSVIDRRDILDKISMIKKTIQGDLPDVYLLHGDLTDEEMNQMYNHPKVKAHLSFTHGEGFGRPLLEASFSGKPIIAPISTGQADFLDKNYTIEIPHILTKVPTGAFPKEFYNPEAQWSTVNYGVAGRMMRQVFENYSKFELKGKKQMIVNTQLFTHEKMSEKLISIVDKVLEGVPQPVKLKIPSLTKEPTKLKLPTLKRG